MNITETFNLVNERWIGVIAVDIGNEGGWVGNSWATKELHIERKCENLRKTFKAWKELHPKVIIAEDVHAIPNQGIVSTGTLMRQKGEVIGMAAALGIEVQFIQPLTWIECFTLKRTKHFHPDSNKKKWKNHLLEIAQSISPFPDDRITLKTADAYLMWIYAASLQTNKPLQPKGTISW